MIHDFFIQISIPPQDSASLEWWKSYAESLFRNMVAARGHRLSTAPRFKIRHGKPATLLVYADTQAQTKGAPLAEAIDLGRA